MEMRWIPAVFMVAAGIAVSGMAAAQTDTGTTLDRMPSELETRFALSAVPPQLRDKATVHLLDPASLLYPFIDRQGNDEQSYMIQLIGEAEKTKILTNEKSLIDDLCAYRDVLCLPGSRD